MVLLAEIAMLEKQEQYSIERLLSNDYQLSLHEVRYIMNFITPMMVCHLVMFGT